MTFADRISLVAFMVGLTGIAGGFEGKVAYATCMVVGGVVFMVLGFFREVE